MENKAIETTCVHDDVSQLVVCEITMGYNAEDTIFMRADAGAGKGKGAGKGENAEAGKDASKEASEGANEAAVVKPYFPLRIASVLAGIELTRETIKASGCGYATIELERLNNYAQETWGEWLAFDMDVPYTSIQFADTTPVHVVFSVMNWYVSDPAQLRQSMRTIIRKTINIYDAMPAPTTQDTQRLLDFLIAASTFEVIGHRVYLAWKQARPLIETANKPILTLYH